MNHTIIPVDRMHINKFFKKYTEVTGFSKINNVESGMKWRIKCPLCGHENDLQVQVDQRTTDGKPDSNYGSLFCECWSASCNSKSEDKLAHHEKILKALGMTGIDAKPYGVTIEDWANKKQLPFDFVNGCCNGYSGVCHTNNNKTFVRGLEIPYLGFDGEDMGVYRIKVGPTGHDVRWKKNEGVNIIPFGRERLKRNEPLFFVEGESDSMTMWFHDKNCLGIAGASNVSSITAEDLDCIEEIYIAREPDAGGNTFIAGFQKRLKELDYQGKAHVFTCGDVKDVSDLHCRNPEAFDQMLEDRLELSEDLWGVVITNTKKENSDGENTKTFKMYPLGELIDKFKEQKPTIINGLMREGDVATLVSEAKIGKTQLINSLAIAVAKGTPWLGFDTVRGKVLLVENELSENDMSQRFQDLFEGKPIPAEISESIIVVSLTANPMDINEVKTQLDSIDLTGFKLVILDALYKFYPADMNENDNAHCAKVFATMTAIATKYNLGIIVIHHTSKGRQNNKSVIDSGAGGGAMARASRNWMVIYNDDPTYRFEAAVGSWRKPKPLRLQYSYPHWMVLGTIEDGEIGKKKITTPAWIEKVFGSRKTMSLSIINAKSKDLGFSRDSTKDFLSKAKDEDLLKEQTAKGKGKGRRQKEYTKTSGK